MSSSSDNSHADPASAPADRAQAEPLAALAAVFAVGVGLSLYVGAFETTIPTLTPGREMTPVAADRFVTEASTFGVLTPPFEGPAAEARPRGYGLNATIRTDEAVWSVGTPIPEMADCERREVSVRVDPGRIHPGWLEVCTWRAL